MGIFHNANMLKMHYVNEETFPLHLLRKAHSIELNGVCTLDEY